MATYRIKDFSGGYNLGVSEELLAINETQNAQNVDISDGSLKTISGFEKYALTLLTGGITRLMKHYHNNLTTGVVTSYLLASTAAGIYKYVANDIDDDKIVTSTNMIVGEYSVAAQPTRDAVIMVTVAAVGATDTLGTIVVVGTLNAGAVTDTIIPVAGSTVYGTKRFDTITTVTGVGWVIGAGNDTIKVGASYEWVELAIGLSNGDWDYTNYQQASTDIVIMGNGTDVLKKWDATTFANLGGTPPVVKSIGLHRERIWGTVDKANPNRVYYSDDFAPENWTAGVDAAGFIDIPTWDGGVCIGLSTIFNDVVIFKTNNIFRVFGTYPGNYQIIQVHSTVGAIAEKTIVSASDRAFFLTKEGLFYYDGVTTKALLGDKIKFTINSSYQQNAVSIIYKNKLYVAFPEGAATTNNAIIVYDLLNNNGMILRGITVTDFIEFTDKLLFTNATGFVFQLQKTIAYDGTAIDAFYETPYTDLGKKNTTKIPDILYLNALGSGSIKIDTTFDGKTKSKTIAVTTTAKVYEIPMTGEGRRFKIKFSNVSGSSFTISAPEMSLEIEED